MAKKFAKKLPKAKLKISDDISKSKYQQAIDFIHKTHGVESIQIGCGTFIDVEVFPSGIYTLDVAMGCLGVPRGRIIEIFGGESSGKTSVTLKMMASCQQTMFGDEPGVVAFIDAEHALDPVWAAVNGVDMSKVLLSQPDNGEQAFGIIETLVGVGIQLIIVDSVAALIPKKELEGDIGDAHVGAQARMMSQALRKLVGKCKRNKTTIVFINQLREKVGVMFGSPETTPGGRALKFYASLRIDMRSSSLLKQGEDVILGRRTTAKIIKNKVAPPWKTAEVNIYFGSPKQSPSLIGVDEGCSLFKAFLETKMFKQKGSFYSYKGKNIGNGEAACIKRINADKELFEFLRSELYLQMKPKEVLEDKDTDDEDINDEQDASEEPSNETDQAETSESVNEVLDELTDADE